MDQLALEIYEFVDGNDDQKCLGIDILINERSLREIIREVERPFAAAEGSPDLAGGYRGLHPEQVLAPSRQLLGEPLKGLRHVSRDPFDVAIFVCAGCGEPGCWPLMVRVEVHEHNVVWSGFNQPHRRDKWSYEALKPFTFDRAQYEWALQKPRRRDSY